MELKDEDLHKKERLLSAKEEEMRDLQDFIDQEKMFKEDSFMAKQVGAILTIGPIFLVYNNIRALLVFVIILFTIFQFLLPNFSSGRIWLMI